MRARALLIVAVLVIVGCGGSEDLTDDEERALAAAPTDDALPEGWEISEAGAAEAGDPVPTVEGCEALAALDVSDALGLVTASIDAPDAELPLLDVNLDVIVMPGPARASSYVDVVADPATPGCLVAINEEVAGVDVVEADAPEVAGGAAARLRFDFPPNDDEAAATLEVVAMAKDDLLVVVEIAYATEVPPPGLDTVLASIAVRLAGAS